ncbi:MAG: HD domain-containing protein [Candidatus Omnitrophica bacterium]|nr:HD domain-containing protein [Candidatus Omnitrophota bacterium]
MFSISDILKKYKEPRAKSAPAVEKKVEVPFQPTFPVKEKDEPSVARSQEKEIVTDETVEKLYYDAVLCAKKLYLPSAVYTQEIFAEIETIVSRISACFRNGNEELIRLCVSEYPSAQHFLPYHAVNVCMLSVFLGSVLGSPPQFLLELGVASFLHDIGLNEYFDIITQGTILSADEQGKIQEHPQKGYDILQRVYPGASHAILTAVYQEHERLDGSGYPRGLKKDEINEYAAIIAPVDVYEAMIHQRPYRSKYTPVEAIFNNKKAFDHKVLKALIERVGIFPVGTLVRLNTKEVAVVTRINPNSPLRPHVDIVLDAHGKKLAQIKQIDLNEDSVIYIEECMKDISIT